MNRADIRMIQRGSGASLGKQAFSVFRLVDHFPRQHFQSDIASELSIVRSIHLAHPALTEQRRHFIRAELLPYCDGHEMWRDYSESRNAVPGIIPNNPQLITY